jgi:hypothetical protein
VKPDDILIALHDLTERERIEFLPLAPDTRKPSSYAPIEKYLLDLKNGSKPETAAEDLFTALCLNVLGLTRTSSAIRRGKGSSLSARNSPQNFILTSRNSAKWAWTARRSTSGLSRN